MVVPQSKSDVRAHGNSKINKFVTGARRSRRFNFRIEINAPIVSHREAT
jgi:hypothetical protein